MVPVLRFRVQEAIDNMCGFIIEHKRIEKTSREMNHLDLAEEAKEYYEGLESSKQELEALLEANAGEVFAVDRTFAMRHGLNDMFTDPSLEGSKSK